jgi:sugar phosphate isomerase/epimerase
VIQGRELALAVLSLRGRAAEAIVAAAATAGFDAVTLRLLDPRSGDHGHLVGDPTARRALRRRMDGEGVALLDVEVARLRPDTETNTLVPALEAAAELGARHVVTLCEDPDEERFLVNLLHLDQLCSERDLACVLEFMPFSECRSFEDAVRVVQRARAVGAIGVGVLVDPLHLRRSGGDPEQVASYAAAAPELFPYLQLCDAPSAAPAGGLAEVRHEAVTSRLLPGDGELPLLALLDALPAGVPLSVETPVRALEMLDDVTRASAAFDACRRLLSGTVPAAPGTGENPTRGDR